MREFFLHILNNLDKLTGLKQMEKLAALPEAKKEINDLLDILCRVSFQFPLIPKDDQKKIISQAVISDPELTSLNARIVYKWLSAHRDRYFKEAAHIPSEELPGWKPVEGEARSEWLNTWQKSLEQMNNTTTKSHVQSLKESVDQLAPKEKGNFYPSTKAEDVLKRELHIEYLKAMNATGLPRSEWMNEQDWINKL